MGCFGGSLEEKNAEKEDDHGSPAHEASENKDAIKNLNQGYLCVISVKNLASLCLCSEHLKEVWWRKL